MATKIGAVYDTNNIYKKEEVFDQNNYSKIDKQVPERLDDSNFNPLKFFESSMPNIKAPSWYNPLYTK